MSFNPSSIQNQNQNQNTTPVHHGGAGHGKKNNMIPIVVGEDVKDSKIKPQKIFNSEIAEININPDAESKQHKRQQAKEKSSKGQKQAEDNHDQPLSLDALELIGQLNLFAVYNIDNIKKPDQT
jgi:phosphoenolpyruvate-protein kinase (PTS system EI component)